MAEQSLCAQLTDFDEWFETLLHGLDPAICDLEAIIELFLTALLGQVKVLEEFGLESFRSFRSSRILEEGLERCEGVRSNRFELDLAEMSTVEWADKLNFFQTALHVLLNKEFEVLCEVRCVQWCPSFAHFFKQLTLWDLDRAVVDLQDFLSIDKACECTHSFR